MVAGYGRRMSPLMALAVAGAFASIGPDVLAPPPNRRRDEPTHPPDHARHSQRAAERRERKRIEADMRERLFRMKIAEGKDDRPDKYLHAAARRRRAAASVPSPTCFRSEGE